MEFIKKIKQWWDNFMKIDIKVDEGADTPVEEKQDPKVEYTCHCEGCDSHEIVTLRDAFNAYISENTGKFSATTLNSYEIVRDRHLQYIMDEKLCELTENKVQTALDNELSKGYTVKTVKSYKSLLNKVFTAYRPDFKPELKVEAK